MPRYFFHIKTKPRQGMSERVLDGHAPNDRTFVVTDEQGRVVLNFPFKEAICD